MYSASMLDSSPALRQLLTAQALVDVAGMDPRDARMVAHAALSAARASPCAKSKRGAVAFTAAAARAIAAFNAPPDGRCPGDDACVGSCSAGAVHAEQRALLAFMGANCGDAPTDVMHVKVDAAGEPVPRGEPTCVDCSKLLLMAGVLRVWLWAEEGWRMFKTAEFHRLSLATARRSLPIVPPLGVRLCAAAVVLRRRGVGAPRVLLVRRGPDAPFDAGWWTAPAGGVEPGDVSLADAAARELREETGALLAPKAAVGRLVEGLGPDRRRGVPRFATALVIGRLADDSPEPRALECHDAAGWFAAHELPERTWDREVLMSILLNQT